MAGLASSSNSSLDLLVAEANDVRSSPVRENIRVFQRSPSPAKSSRATPTRNQVYQLQDFYLDTPTRSQDYRPSPTRSVAEAENLISPWRIRVRVEAEREDALQTRMSISPSKARSRVTTVAVPLHDESDDSNPRTRAKRVRKATNRRPPTPKPTKSTKRVLAEVENEADQRQSTPKRVKSQSALKDVENVQGSIENDDQPLIQLDDLLEAALTRDETTEPATGNEEATKQSTDHPAPRSPVRRSPAKQKSRSSPFKFRRQGQDVSVLQTKEAASSNGKTRRQLLISDFAEPRPEFDSIMEGEDFSMVSLSSVPSAQQHLSQRKDAQKSQSASKQTRRPRPRPTLESPTVVGRSGIFQSQYTGRKNRNTQPVVDDMQRLATVGDLDPENANIQQSQASDSADSEDEDRVHGERYNVDERHNLADSQANDDRQEALDVGEDADDNADVEPIVDLQTNVQHTIQFTSDATSDPEVENIIDQEEHEHNNYEIDEPPDYLPDGPDELEEPYDNESGEELDDPVSMQPSTHLHRIDSTRKQVHYPSEEHPSLVTSRPVIETTSYVENDRNEQSSLLHLPQKSRTPSRVFSSPVLPDLPSPQHQQLTQARQPAGPSPRLSRVANAGRALQSVVEPSSLQQSREATFRSSVQPQPDNLFSGFSAASRRELRAGLRLGEELAKRQTSILDISMRSPSARATSRPTSSAPSTPPPRLRSSLVPAVQPSPSMKQPKPSMTNQSHLLSPETSLNSTERQRNSRRIVDDALQPSITRSTKQADEHAESLNQVKISKQVSTKIEQQLEPQIEEQSGYTDHENDGFASDHDQDHDLQPLDETDIWQLEARSTTTFRESVAQEKSLARTGRSIVQQQDFLLEEINQADETAPDDENSEDPNIGEVHDFDEEQAAQSSNINTPAKLSGILTPSDTASSPAARMRQQNLEFTNFTGFTQDLLQAAKRAPYKRHTERILEHPEEHTPARKNLTNPYADVFTTRSLLETSGASIKTPRIQARRPISFRPTNRKESWLFDPARLRKPPSPMKASDEMKSTAQDPFDLPQQEVLDDGEDFSPKTENDELDPAELESEQELNPESAPIVQTNVSIGRNMKATPSPPPIESSPLSIFVAAQQRKAMEQQSKREQNAGTKSNVNKLEISQQPVSRPSLFSQPAKRASKPVKQVRIVSEPLPTDSSRPSSSDQTSRLQSQQSSFVSNATSNTIDSRDETQSTWFSLLSNAATPFIASTKVITNLAATAFQQSQHKTFWPDNEHGGKVATVLTKHLPFNDAHWNVLRRLYISASSDPHKYPLNLRSRCADYLGLDVESLGWKRELKEWELAVVARFLALLDEKGVVNDSEQQMIDIEDVVKRVFSLWVGMVTRQELDLTDGKAGAWDRRFVGRRDEVLRKQKAWLRSQA